MSNPTYILHFNVGSLIACASIFISNVKDDEEELTRILSKSSDEIYLTHEEKVEFFEKHRFAKSNAEKILAWAEQAAVLEIPSLNVHDFRRLVDIVVILSANISEQYQFHSKHQMDDYFSDKNIQNNWSAVNKMESALAEIREVVIQD